MLLPFRQAVGLQNWNVIVDLHFTLSRCCFLDGPPSLKSICTGRTLTLKRPIAPENFIYRLYFQTLQLSGTEPQGSCFYPHSLIPVRLSVLSVYNASASHIYRIRLCQNKATQNTHSIISDICLIQGTGFTHSKEGHSGARELWFVSEQQSTIDIQWIFSDIQGTY